MKPLLFVLALVALACDPHQGPAPEDYAVHKLGVYDGCTLWKHQDRSAHTYFLTCPVGRIGTVLH